MKDCYLLIWTNLKLKNQRLCIILATCCSRANLATTVNIGMGCQTCQLEELESLTKLMFRFLQKGESKNFHRVQQKAKLAA